MLNVPWGGFNLFMALSSTEVVSAYMFWVLLEPLIVLPSEMEKFDIFSRFVGYSQKTVGNSAHSLSNCVCID